MKKIRKIKRSEITKTDIKKTIRFALVFAGPLSMLILLIYFILGETFFDLLKWNAIFLYIFIFVCVISASPLIFTLLDLYSAKRSSKRKHIPSRVFWAFGIFGLIVPVGLMGVLLNVNISSGDKAPQLLIISGTGANGIPDLAVVYWTETPKNLELKWGTTSSMTETSLSQEEDGISNQHVFIFEDLNQNQTYFYQISGESQVYNFTTVSTTIPETLRFGISSDCHFGAGTNDVTTSLNILKSIANTSDKYDMFFATGDLVEYGFMDSQWTEFLNTTSPYTTHIPFRPLIGNHDGIVGGVNSYQKYLYPESLPVNGSQYYYHNLVNGIHIFGLDLEWGTESYSLEQKAWFEAELDNIDAEDWIIVMSHCFFYGSGGLYDGMQWWDHPEMIAEFNSLFIQHDVDLVFSGHNHQLEALNNSGVMYNIVGGFGGLLDAPAEEHGGINSTHSLWYKPGQFGFADVNISGDFATIKYRTPENSILQEFIHYK